MAKISTYEEDSTPQLADKVIGTSIAGPPDNNTSNFTFQSILGLFLPEITLQQVTTAGNVTNNDISVNSLSIYDGPNGEYCRIAINDSYFTISRPQSPFPPMFAVDNGYYLQLINDNGGSATIVNNLIAVSRSYTLPNASGTFALTSDIVVPTLQQVTNAGATTTKTITITPSIGQDGMNISAGDENGIYSETTGGTSIYGYNSADGLGVQGYSLDGYAVYGATNDGIGVWGSCTNEGGAIVADGGSSGLGTGINVLNGGVNILGTLNPVTGYQLKLSANSAAKPSTNTWTITSDERVKTNVNPYTKGLEAILSINPITYDYNGKAGFDSTTTGNIGIIAQDVLNIIPECINTYKAKLNEDDEEKTELYNFDSHALTFILINAIKQLSAEIEILKSK